MKSLLKSTATLPTRGTPTFEILEYDNLGAGATCYLHDLPRDSLSYLVVDATLLSYKGGQCGG